MNNIYKDAETGRTINLANDTPLVYFENRLGVVTYAETRPETVWESLSHELIAKKVNQCRYISRIVRRSNYDGTQTITVYYAKDCGGGKRVYHVSA